MLPTVRRLFILIMCFQWTSSRLKIEMLRKLKASIGKCFYRDETIPILKRTITETERRFIRHVGVSAVNRIFQVAR